MQWLRWFMGILNDNAGALQVVFAALVALATLVYALLTSSLVRETRRMRRAQTSAKMTIGLDVRPEYMNFVDLVLRNEGLGPAYDVRFEATLVGEHGDTSVLETIQSLGFIEKGIGYFSPNQEIRSYLASILDDFEAKMNTEVRVRIGYRTAAGKRETDEYILDFSIFKGRTQLGTPDLYRIAKSLEAIGKNVDDIATGHKKPRIITQTSADARREQEEHYERIRSMSQSEERTDDNEVA